MSAKDQKALEGKSVLVIEDDLYSMDVAILILKHHGADTRTACNGREGLAVLQDFRPDLILCDLSMPVMDGWQFVTEIKQYRELAEIPIFALTAHAVIGDREKAISAGFHNYMTKPFTPKTFITQLLHLLEMEASF